MAAALGVDPVFVADLLTGLGAIDHDLAERATDHILAWPKTYALDPVLVPAARRLMRSTDVFGLPAVERLRTACLAHLRARVAEPLAPPDDYRRASALTCHCHHCNELGLYLVDPARRTWIFKAAEADRSHVEGTIKHARCDLDATTDRRGRPYSLVCAKNQASYERRAAQRTQALEDLAGRVRQRGGNSGVAEVAADHAATVEI
ncbi:MAG: hypothetical protein M3Y41_01655 [Pseudomonadota bacterium]|nr:hypothetical protein [Pseudomonadota bacterium]